MQSWPINPIAGMIVDNYPGGDFVSASFFEVSDTQTVLDVDIEWSIQVAYDDHPYWDHGRGYFRARVYRLSDTPDWVLLDTSETTLGNDNDNGYWTDFLTLHATMARDIEIFQIELYCALRDVIIGDDFSISRTFTAVQGTADVGSFTLDYLPVSTVYCPPNQDMSASLTQSSQYGTRLTIGTSEGFQAQTNVGGEIDAIGFKVIGVSTTDSHSVTNHSQAGIELSYFRNTVLTADNQRAIGRAYWGPLGDIFVIAVNPQFAVSRKADGTLFYTTTNVQQLIVVPAYKLLRPAGDPIVEKLPDDVRQQILDLDPFLTNLDQFFPDSGAPLLVAANPYADPSVNNRAECLGRWWLNNATELNYSIGETKELKTGEATESQFQSTVTLDDTVGINLFDIIGVNIKAGGTWTTTIGLQSSKETVNTTSKTAACYLIRNQNEKDLDAIEIYYDKIFSTFMFRKIPARGRWITGVVKDPRQALLGKLEVSLVTAGGLTQKTTSDQAGRYSFANVEPGIYTIIAGDQSRQVEIYDAGEDSITTADINLTNVRRPIDLQRSAAWEVSVALRLSSDAVWRLGRHLDGVFDETDLAHLSGLDEGQIKAAADRLIISWPRSPLQQLEGISEEEVGRLQQIGVTSVQELWRRGQKREDLNSVAERAGIPVERLRHWVVSADRRRVSKTKEGLPGQPPPKSKGCLGLFLNWIPWGRLRRFRS